jgi:hypothetical protein
MHLKSFKQVQVCSHIFPPSSHFASNTTMKRANESTSLHRSNLKKLNRSGVGAHCAKDVNKVNRNGKSSSLGHASSESECNRAFSLIPRVLRFLLPPVISPGKEDHSSLKQSVVTRGSSESRLGCASFNWLSRSMMVAKICKYESQDDMIPKTQEDQLKYLMDKFTLTNLKTAYHVTAGKIGVDMSSVMLPYKVQKDTVIS